MFNNLSRDDVLRWRTKDENSANRLAGRHHPQFTCSMWPGKSRKETPTVQNNPKTFTMTRNFFRCLDTELVWRTNGNLGFRVHLKPNQQLKCLHPDIIHTKPCFKAIPSGVCNRMSELTTITETNKNLPLGKIYLHHSQALQHAGLVTQKVPTLIEQLQHNKQAKTLKQADCNSNDKRNRTTTTCFGIGHSKIWSKPVQSMITSIKDRAKFNLQWFTVSMSCHMFQLSTLEKHFKEIC